MTIDKFEVSPKFSYLDFIFGGCEIGLSIVIDFTASNKDPEDPLSLHYLGDLQKNQYYNAIKSVGRILQYYDSDKMIPTFGFGARVPPHQHLVNHCFALNGDIFNPECDGIDGVIDTYYNAI
jgi:hypothetical protein